MKALILAWGFATRLWPITEKRAKPLLFLKNKEIISHIVERIPEEHEIIISTNKVFEEDFINWKKQKYPNRNINIFIEDSDNDDAKKWALWATSLAIQSLNINEDLLLIAWDNYFWFDFKDMFSKFKWNPLVAWYDIKDKQKASSFWVIISKNLDTVDSFEEKPINPSSTLVSTWCYIFPKKNLKDIIYYSVEHNDDLWWIFEYLKQKWDTINIFTFDEAWFDIWSFDWYISANKLLQDKKFIWKNSSVNNSTLDNNTFIWDNCSIENSNIENSIIMQDVTIKDSELRNCIIDKNSTISWIGLTDKLIREESYFVR